MVEGAQAGGAYAREQRAKGRRARRRRAQQHGIGEEPDDPLEFGKAAPHHRRADDQLLFARVPGEQHGEHREEDHEGGRALGARERRQGVHDRAREDPPGERTLVAGRGGHRPVGRQVEARRRPRQRVAPPAEQRLEPVTHEGASLPRRVVGEVDRERRQRHVDAALEPVVQRAQLAHEHVARPAVGRDVVRHELQHVVLGAQADERRAQLRIAFEVEGHEGERAHLGTCRGLALVARYLGHVATHERHGHRRMNHLPRFVADELQRGAQDRMARHERVEGPLQRVLDERSRQSDRARDVIGRARARALEPEEHLLREGERHRRLGIALRDREHRCLRRRIEQRETRPLLARERGEATGQLGAARGDQIGGRHADASTRRCTTRAVSRRPAPGRLTGVRPCPWPAAPRWRVAPAARTRPRSPARTSPCCARSGR